ncbi:MAG TPA: ABC transporter ATP-binding protein [Saprospiraceae bacterium]|nr:ABC transporter ATP-binding protein [Saprospiraceae bacterium]MCB9328347.1 ABC transporter ATP-binding protein [Lewinellaceae bacterium]HPQ20946.1 ABC transporter ATP-binding protein [Saprospiraceae bacterium]HRX29961.1 ABC transporter ATP-binding protein [Saprospiraceae bacterium]
MEVIVKNISKSYDKKKVLALSDISFEVNSGELFGLIGPDGAGKTSLFRILATLLLPDEGSASLHGFDVVKSYKQIRKLLGYMPGKFSLYQDLTIEENLDFFATLFNTTIKENYDLIKDIYVQIEPFKNRRAGQLSGGMKQKLALCCALIHRPTILLLDEPTTGVDAVSRKEFWEMLKNLKKQGITILVSTPYMDEAMLCERIALIQNGSIMSIDTPQGIIDKYPYPLFAARADNMGKLLKDLRSSSLISSCNTFGDYHHICFVNDTYAKDIPDLKQDMIQLGNQNIEIKPIEPTIEDCFIQLMQK